MKLPAFEIFHHPLDHTFKFMKLENAMYSVHGGHMYLVLWLREDKPPDYISLPCQIVEMGVATHDYLPCLDFLRNVQMAYTNASKIPVRADCEKLQHTYQQMVRIHCETLHHLEKVRFDYLSKKHSALIIWKMWCVVLANPYHPFGIRRLEREYKELIES